MQISVLCIFIQLHIFLKYRALTEKKSSPEKRKYNPEIFSMSEPTFTHMEWKNLIEIHQNLLIILYIHAHFGCFIFSQGSKENFTGLHFVYTDKRRRIALFQIGDGFSLQFKIKEA